MIHVKRENILLGVTGGIAVYMADLVSKLKKPMWKLMTEAAMEFVNPLTFQTMSNNLYTLVCLIRLKNLCGAYFLPKRLMLY